MKAFVLLSVLLVGCSSSDSTKHCGAVAFTKAYADELERERDKLTRTEVKQLAHLRATEAEQRVYCEHSRNVEKE